MEVKGWIKVNRKIQDHWIWSKDKQFDCRSAWLDILLSANHKDNKFPLGTEIIEVPRGSFITSEIKLMERWGWSKTKVRTFLKLLENDEMIVKKSDRKKTTITIVNYSIYQKVETTEEPQENHSETTEEPLRDTNKNEKNDKNDKKDDNTIKDSIVSLTEKKTYTDYQKVVDLYNNICVSYPTLKKLSDARKKAIKARLNSYTIDDFKTLFENAESSDFLKGKNNNDWSASFDWLIKDNNMAKVLEGNYRNKDDKNNSNEKEANSSDYEEFFSTAYYEKFK